MKQNILGMKDIILSWWKSEEKIIAWTGLLCIMLLSILSTYLIVLLNNWLRDLYSSLEEKDLDKFIHQLFLFVPLLSLLVAEFCSRNYIESWLGFKWRRWYSAKILAQWLTSKTYYRGMLIPGALDNPDQRISMDVSQVCYIGVALFSQIFREGIIFLTLAVYMWQLSSGFTITIFNQTIVIHGCMLWCAILYSGVVTFCTFKIGSPLITLNESNEKLEADFRFRLLRILERREEVAVLNGEIYENDTIGNVFKGIAKNFNDILRRNIYLNVTQNFFLNLDSLFSLIIAGPQYLSGVITFGVLMQINNIFFRISKALSVLSHSFSAIASWLASIRRLIKFHESFASTAMMVKQTNTPDNSNFTTDNRLSELPTASILVQDLIIFSPEGKAILNLLRLELAAGQKKILLGKSGIGKSSLVKVIAGIYPFYDGKISLPKEPIFIIPQKPYMPIGRLSECLSYPAKEFPTDELHKYLKFCHLENLLEDLDTIQNWQDRLSLGEQQRINFVRILLHKPKWLIMDEPTANLNEEYGEYLINLLITELPKSAMLIISHKNDGKKYMDDIITLSN